MRKRSPAIRAKLLPSSSNAFWVYRTDKNKGCPPYEAASFCLIQSQTYCFFCLSRLLLDGWHRWKKEQMERPPAAELPVAKPFCSLALLADAVFVHCLLPIASLAPVFRFEPRSSSISPAGSVFEGYRLLLVSLTLALRFEPSFSAVFPDGFLFSA